MAHKTAIDTASDSQPTHAFLRDAGLPPAEVCAEYSVEAAKNAGRLREVAKAASNLGADGVAVALLVLAVEEAVKADLMTMVWKTALLHPDLDALVKNPGVITKRDHRLRHLVASRQLYANEILRLHLGGMQDEAVELAAHAVAAQVTWLIEADGLKQRGLYVDPLQRSSPSTFTKADYDRALRLVGPYVAASMQHAGSLPRERPRASREPTP